MYTYGITGTSIDEFQDTTVTAVTGGQALVYNDVTGQWENTDIVSGIDDLSDVGLTSTTTGQVLRWDGTQFVNANPSIDDLSDVGLTSTTTGQVLQWDGTQFVNANPSIDDLSDVGLTSVQNEQVLQYNSTTSQWENKAAKTVVRDNTQAQGEPQAPANGRLHGPNNTLLLIIGVGVYLGGVMKIVFNQACTVTEVGIVLASAYAGVPSYTYRVGAYADDGTGDFPGALIEDLGLVTISTGAAAGFKGVALTTPLAVAAGTTIWTAVNCQHFGAGLPIVAYSVGNTNPYVNYGIATTGSTNASAFNQNGTQATALANPFALAANPVTSQAVVGYVKVTVP